MKGNYFGDDGIGGVRRWASISSAWAITSAEANKLVKSFGKKCGSDRDFFFLLNDFQFLMNETAELVESANTTKVHMHPTESSKGGSKDRKVGKVI